MNASVSWFARFRSRNFDVKDEPRPGRPIVEKVDEILRNIEVNRHISSRDITTELNIDHKTVLKHLHKTGYQKKLDTWVPHELTVKNLMDRVFICESLLKPNDVEPYFFKRMITGDETCVTYNNNVRKRSWLKPGEASQTVAKPVYWRQGRWCWVFGGIGKELFIMSCSNLAKPLIRLSTVNN